MLHINKDNVDKYLCIHLVQSGDTGRFDGLDEFCCCKRYTVKSF